MPLFENWCAVSAKFSAILSITPTSDAIATIHTACPNTLTSIVRAWVFFKGFRPCIIWMAKQFLALMQSAAMVKVKGKGQGRALANV